MGRFISPDPAGFAEGPNLYAYVGNDPVNLIDPFGLNGVPLKLTDIKKLAQLAESLDATRHGTRFNIRGRYTTVSGPRGRLVAGTRYRSDNPAIAQYINPAAAAKEALNLRGAGGVTALVVTTQDVLEALANGEDLTSRAFLADTGVDVAVNLGSGAVGAYAGVYVGSLGGSVVPIVGTVAGGIVGYFVGKGLDSLVEATQLKEFLGGQE